MEMYAGVEDYKDNYGGTLIPDKDLEKSLKKASRHIDTLTFNRIVGRGIEILTSWQQEIIRECCCEMADFEYENADLIESVLSNYSINGVSMTFAEGWNMEVKNGVAIRRDVYAKLETTGLCCRVLR